MNVAIDTTRAPAISLLYGDTGLLYLLAELAGMPPLERAHAAAAASQQAVETLSLIRGEAINQAVAEQLPSGRRRSYADVATVLGITIYGVNAAVHRYRRWLGTRHA